MLQAIRMSNGLGGRPDNANLLTGAASDVPPSDSAADVAAGFTAIDLRPGGAPAAAATTAAAAAAAGGKPGSAPRSAAPGGGAQRRYFRPPPLSCARCTRALFAIFVGRQTSGTRGRPGEPNDTRGPGEPSDTRGWLPES